MTRPRPITLIGWLFIFTGIAGLLADLWPLVTPRAAEQLAKLQADGWADLGPAWGLRVLAIVGGVGLLKGQNWARWLLALWMVTHIAISLFHSLGEVAAHCAIFLPILYLLFRRPSRPWFEPANGAST